MESKAILYHSNKKYKCKKGQLVIKERLWKEKRGHWETIVEILDIGKTNYLLGLIL